MYYTNILTYTYENYTYNDTFNTSTINYTKPTSLQLYIQNNKVSTTYTNTSTLTTIDTYDKYNIRYAGLILGFSIGCFIIFFCIVVGCAKEYTHNTARDDLNQCSMFILLIIIIVGFAIIPVFYHNNNDVINTSYVMAYNYTTVEPVITTTETTTETTTSTIILTQDGNYSINSIDITMVTGISIIIILLICMLIYIVSLIKKISNEPEPIRLNNNDNIKKVDNLIAKIKLVDLVVQNGVYGDINTELAQRYEKIKIAHTCTICANEENAYVYPCGHMIGLKCHEQMTDSICHMCRTEYEIAIKIFA